MDRKHFEEWFKTTDAYKLLEEMNYFKIDLFIFKEHRSQYQHTTVQIAYMTWQHQQAKVDDANKGMNFYFNLAQENGAERNELQNRLDAFKDHAVMLRKAAKSYAYTESEQNILLSQADDIEKILGLEQALKGEGQ